VPVVLGVAVAVVDVVDVFAVRHGDMAAVRSVLVGVALVDRVGRGLALVGVALVQAVQMAVVDVVDMVGVRDRDMAAAGAVLVGVVAVQRVGGCGHADASP
jgi:hypothetical protein